MKKKEIETRIIVVDLPIGLIVIPKEYQRKLNQQRVQKIMDTYDIDKLDPIKVSYRNGKYYVFDGQHRYVALASLGAITVPCRVVKDCTLKREAKLFAEQDDNVARVSTVAKYKANLVAEEGNSLIIKEITDKYSVKICPKNKSNCNYVSAMNTLDAIVGKYGKAGLDSTLKALTKVWGVEKVLGSAFFDKIALEGMAYFVNELNTPKIDFSSLDKKLSGHPLDGFCNAAKNQLGTQPTYIKFANLILEYYNKGRKVKFSF